MMNLNDLKIEYKALRKKISDLCDTQDNIANELCACFKRTDELEKILGITFLDWYE